MASFELRFRGQLLSHYPSEEAANAAADKADLHKDSAYRAGFTVAPRKPVELHIRGNLSDTFDTKDAATAKALLLGGAEVVDRSKGEKTAADVATEPPPPPKETLPDPTEAAPVTAAPALE